MFLSSARGVKKIQNGMNIDIIITTIPKTVRNMPAWSERSWFAIIVPLGSGR
jgi:hypothetical protein